MSRASILLQLGLADAVISSAWVNIQHLRFQCADIKIDFDDDNLFDQTVVDEALAKMDAIIADCRKESERRLAIINSWEG